MGRGKKRLKTTSLNTGLLTLLNIMNYRPSRTVVPKVGGTAPLGAVRNSRGAVKQKWAVRGR